jgi:hypothetical protein
MDGHKSFWWQKIAVLLHDNTNRPKLINVSRSLILITIALLIVAPSVSALTSGDVKSVLNNTSFYDPIGDAQTCDSSNPTNATLAGSDNIEKAFNFFKGKGLSDDQAAGIVGNLIAESSLDPEADSGSGYKGIAQWNVGGRWDQFLAWAESTGAEPYSLGAQLNYAWKEANDRGNIAGIKKHDDYKLATWYWGRYFEVAIIDGSTSETPMTNVQNLDGRVIAAGQTLDKYGGGSGGVVVSSGTTSGCASEGASSISASCTNVNAAPPNDFKIVSVPGTSEKTDVRTLYMMNLANDCLKQLGEKPFTVIQGSYCGFSCASASGTSHNKGATVDIRTSDQGGIQKVYILLKVLREVGFAAWYRDGNDNPSFGGNEHIHAVALGAPQTGPNAPGSTDQLILYCTGGDGLNGGQKDRQLAIVGRPLPEWALSVKPDCTRYP